MSSERTTYWHGQPISQLSRGRLEQVADSAINQLLDIAERERLRRGFDLAGLAFLAGGLLAGLGALAGILLAQ